MNIETRILPHRWFRSLLQSAGQELDAGSALHSKFWLRPASWFRLAGAGDSSSSFAIGDNHFGYPFFRFDKPDVSPLQEASPKDF